MNHEQTLDEMKSVLPSLIRYFYAQHNNSAGGHLHIVLDDGNVEPGHIQFCRDAAVKAGDKLAVLIAELLQRFRTKELEQMYENRWEFRIQPRNWGDVANAIWGDDDLHDAMKTNDEDNERYRTADEHEPG